MFLSVFTRVYNSSVTWATSIPSLNSLPTSSRSPAIYLPIYAFIRLYESHGLLECDSVYFDRRSLMFPRNILLAFSGQKIEAGVLYKTFPSIKIHGVTSQKTVRLRSNMLKESSMKLLPLSVTSRSWACISHYLPPSRLWSKKFSWVYEQQIRHDQNICHLQDEEVIYTLFLYEKCLRIKALRFGWS
jgi:hypothetical protein